MSQESASSRIEPSPLMANLFEVRRAMDRGRRLIVIMTLAASLSAVVLALVLPRVYRARVTLMPQQTNMSNTMLLYQLSGSMGLPLSGSDTMEEMYSEIVRSDWMLDKMLPLSWPTGNGQERISLYEALGYKDVSVETTDLVLEALKTRIVDFQRNRLNGFMEIDVDFPKEPQIACALANALADSLARFVQSKHMNTAKDKRIYIEQRLETTSSELSAAQDSLMEFSRDNVAYETSPSLSRKHRDLLRKVNAKSATWIELTRQLELTRLKENDTTVKIAILDRAKVPRKPIRPKRAVIVMVGTFFGFALGLATVLLRDQFAARRTAE